MAIDWGSWKYGGGNGMRVGMEVTWSGVNSGSGSVTATVDFWTENQYSYSDAQSLNISNNLGSNHSYTNSSGGSPVKRTTRTYTYNYSTWGSSPGSVTFGATVEGTYNSISPSVSVAYTIPARPGGVPTSPSISASANIGSISVSWSASADPGITQYSVYRNNDPNQLIYASTGTSLTDNVGNGASAYYVMYAYNAVGVSSAAVSGTVTTPSVPGAPGISSTPNNGFISVSYSAPASNGGNAITSYQYSVNNGAWTTTPSNPFNVSGSNGTAITVAVRAVNGVGAGGSSSTTNTPRTIPTSPTSFAGNNSTFGQLVLSWAAPSSNGGSAVTTYKLYNGATLLQNSLSTSYTHTGLLPYTDYSYTVVATNVAGDSPVASLTVKTMGGIAKIWNGTSYITVLPKVWNGTTWTDAQARMWNGTEWKHGI